MKIVIIGGKGFIGKKLHKEIPEAVCIDLKQGQNAITCELPEADIVYLLASQTSVEASWHDPVHDMDNLRITARIVKKYPNAKIIFTNSCASLNPKSPYGFSKKVSGEYIKTFHTNYVNLVFPNIYGGSEQSVVDIFKGKDEVTIFGDGSHVRDYVHVDDIVDGLLKAKDWNVGEYFMGSGKGTTVLELAKGKKINFAPERKEETEITLKNTTPNWTPKINVLEYIK